MGDNIGTNLFDNMKTLSIKQPWASLIAHGIKDVENRTWRTKHRGRIYIHASGKPAFTHKDYYKNLTQKQVIDALNAFGGVWPKFIDSAIIGEVEIVDCGINHPSIWAEKDCWNWVLANPVIYDKPILNVKGALSLWEYERPYQVIGTAEMAEGHTAGGDDE